MKCRCQKRNIAAIIVLTPMIAILAIWAIPHINELTKHPCRLCEEQGLQCFYEGDAVNTGAESLVEQWRQLFVLPPDLKINPNFNWSEFPELNRSDYSGWNEL